MMVQRDKFSVALAAVIAGVLAGKATAVQAALVVADGTVVYRGAIDDRITDDGVMRAEARRHFVREAIEAVAAGRPVETPVTRAIGCHILFNIAHDHRLKAI